MSTRKALLQNTVANAGSKLSALLFRLVQVPVLLSVLGVEEYGHWLVLASLPTWITLANFGFGSVAANTVSIATAAGELNDARAAYSTALSVIVAVAAVGTVAIGCVTDFVPWENYLRVSTVRHEELVMAASYLGIAVLLSFFSEIFGSRFRAARETHRGVALSSLKPWIELGAMLTAAQLSTRLDYIAGGMLVAEICFQILYYFASTTCMPGLCFSRHLVRPGEFTALLKKGISFQAIPLGNALVFQGNVLIVQWTMGATAVVVFGTARTLVRSVNQAMELINQIIWPEMSHLFGSKELVKAARLHRIGIGASLIVAVVSSACLAMLGPTVYRWWIGGGVSVPYSLLLCFILPIPFNALWSTSAVVHFASNQHEGLAIRYVVASGIAAIACLLLSSSFGLFGAAISTLAVDLILIPFVLRRSIMITGEQWRDFTSGTLTDLRAAPQCLTQSAARVRAFVVTRNAGRQAHGELP